MPSKQVQLTLLRGSKPATLYSLAQTKQAEAVTFDLQFLHRVRDPRWLGQYPDWATSEEASSYYSQLPKATKALASELRDTPMDLVLTPPSRRHDAEPYLAELKRYFRDAVDLSRSVHRVRDVSAGANPGAVEFAASIALTFAGSLSNFRSVLIVDDVYSSGTTAAAIVFRLEQFGLHIDAQITIAAPLIAAP
jgi:hypothetical protein